jgi:hypothetical protein
VDDELPMRPRPQLGVYSPLASSTAEIGGTRFSATWSVGSMSVHTHTNIHQFGLCWMLLCCGLVGSSAVCEVSRASGRPENRKRKKKKERTDPTGRQPFHTGNPLGTHERMMLRLARFFTSQTRQRARELGESQTAHSGREAPHHEEARLDECNEKKTTTKPFLTYY